MTWTSQGLQKAALADGVLAVELAIRASRSSDLPVCQFVVSQTHATNYQR